MAEGRVECWNVCSVECGETSPGKKSAGRGIPTAGAKTARTQLLFGDFDLGEGQFLFAFDFRHGSGGHNFLGAMANVLCETFADVIFHQVIGLSFALFLRLNDGFAGTSLMKHAGGAFGIALNGDFLVARQCISSV